MTLWLRTRHALSLLATLLALLVAGRLCGERTVVLPTVVGAGANAVPLGTFLPLAWASALADAVASTRQAVEVRPGPRLRVLDATLFLVLVAGAAGVVLGGLGPVLVLSGVCCIATLRAGPAYGVLASSALLILTMLYGVAAPAGRYVRVLESDGAAAWSATCGLVLCGIAAWLLVTNRIPTVLGATETLD